MAEEFCILLGEGIKDEAQAKEFYERLKRAAEMEFELTLRDVMKSVIDEVANAETSHEKLLKSLKQSVCGGE